MEDMKDAVAVVGVGVRAPGADGVDEFWAVRQNGEWQGRMLTDAEADEAGIPATRRSHPGFVPVVASPARVAEFDAAFFGISPRDAALYDPQFRMLLEVAWNGFEDAQVDPAAFGGKIGVIVGAGSNSYLWTNVLPAMDGGGEQADAMQVRMATDKDFLAPLLSYTLGLEGPAITVQTACSSSLVAVHQGVQALLSREADLVLAGGVSVILPQEAGSIYQPEGIASPDGRCRPFDARADGTFGGSGAGVVLLRRLADALADGDPVRAVIRGSAVNNDGSRKVGFTAPSMQAQVEVFREALAVAEVDPGDVALVETHGTGTHLGDLVEFEALRTVYGAPGARPCVLGTLKASVGHLDAAAGVVGLIGTVLNLEHGRLPASPWATAPHPLLELGTTRFTRPLAPQDWPARDAPRRAAVTALGIGGTNAHVVLEEPPRRAAPPPGAPQVFLLSAASGASLAAQAARYARRTEHAEDGALPALAASTRCGRRAFPLRAAVVAGTPGQAAARFRAIAGSRPPMATARPRAGEVAFLLPGQGAQAPGMGEDLYRDWPAYRDAFDECADLLGDLGPSGEGRTDLRDAVFGPRAAELLARTEFAQPALFAVEYSLARLWARLGITPAALLGHSVGEYTAACLAGVFDLPDALRLVALRGRLMQELPPGAMIAVGAGEARILPLLDAGLDIAAVNSPGQVVVTGPAEAVDRLEHRLAGEGLPAQRLASSRPFHSRGVEPVLEALGKAVQAVPRRPPAIPVLSNETGTWADPAEIVTPEYWMRHTRQPVRFADAIARLVRAKDRVLLEVGPGQVLTGLTRRRLRTSTQTAIASLPEAGPSAAGPGLVEAAAMLWNAGADVDWTQVPGTAGRQAVGTDRMPGYAFTGERAWLPYRPAGTAAPAGSTAALRPAEATNARTSPSHLTGVIRSVWGEVFGREHIAADDDFFDLGGTSLLAAQAVSRLRRELSLAVPMSALFLTTTPRTLAESLAQAPGAANSWEGLPDGLAGRLPDGLAGELPGGLAGGPAGRQASRQASRRAGGPAGAQPAPYLDLDVLTETELDDLESLLDDHEIGGAR